jgi:threonine/homoserine/homoserine lactone efflux protein
MYKTAAASSRFDVLHAGPASASVNELAGFVAFAFVGTVSPGPNNAVLWASGLSFGFARTLPHVLGTALGMGTLVVSVAAGLGALIEAVPAAEVALKVVGSVYLLYLAYRVARSGSMTPTRVSGPLTLWQAIGFQWANPKAWIFVIATVATFLPPQFGRIVGVALVTTMLMIIVVGTSSIWAAGGAALGRLIQDERRRRVLNVALAALLVASVVLIWE